MSRGYEQFTGRNMKSNLIPVCSFCNEHPAIGYYNNSIRSLTCEGCYEYYGGSIIHFKDPRFKVNQVKIETIKREIERLHLEIERLENETS
jgi:hypothetical protein